MPFQHELGSDFVSVVVADGTRIHTQLLAEALRSDRGLQVVAEAATSQELLSAITRVPIDVAIVSHNLDDQPGRGAEILREMRALRPQIKSVILLDSSRSHEVLDCFRAGARGIFSQEERLESLCKCIRSVHEGQIWARSVDLDHALEALVHAPLVRATNQGGMELLSTRERQVVSHLAEGRTNREIATALQLSPHTVKNYLFRIFDKLGVSTRTELLYLTMNSSSAETGSDSSDRSRSLSSLLLTAGEGDPSAQIRLAQYFYPLERDHSSPAPGDVERKIEGRKHSSGKSARRKSLNEPQAAQRDPVSAYMWYMVAQKAVAGLAGKIEVAKNELKEILSPEQFQEAETRAATIQPTRKPADSTGAVSDLMNESEMKKMHAGAR